jgi:hypothetical protein
MPYPNYTLNFVDGSKFPGKGEAKKALKAAAAGGAVPGIKIGVKGSHSTFMDVGSHRFQLEITHSDEQHDKEPILDIVITPA